MKSTVTAVNEFDAQQKVVKKLNEVKFHKVTKKDDLKNAFDKILDILK